MTKRRHFAMAVFLSSVLGTALPAAAEDYVPASSGKRYTPIRGPELRAITGFTVGVPIFMDTDRSVARPGADLFGWVGLDIGWLVFAVGFGASWNPIDLDNAPGGEGLGKSPLTRLYLTPEVRFQVPTAKAVLPYLSGAFDANWWRHREVNITTACNVWYCDTRARFAFTPGFTAKLGIGIRAADRIYVDVGVKYSLSGAGSFFAETEMWVTPYVGVLYRGDPD